MLADKRILPVRQLDNKIMRPGELGRSNDLFHWKTRIDQGDIVPDGTVEQKVFL